MTEILLDIWTVIWVLGTLRCALSATAEWDRLT